LAIEAATTALQTAQGQGAVSLVGTGRASSAATGAATALFLAIDSDLDGTAATGATSIITASRAIFAADVHASAKAYLRGAGAGHLALTRAGLGDALVAGYAARRMALLGAAQAMSIARGAANLPLAPGLAGRAMTAVRMDLAGLGIATAGRANARGTVMITTAASAWAVALTARALNAPPALRRAAAPRIGLSGRIMPTNSGRILRG
jgi:hypothetical protein